MQSDSAQWQHVPACNVVNFLEERSEKFPISAALGITFEINNYSRFVLQTGIGYLRMPYRQKIEVMADQNNTFSVERSIINESVAIPLVLFTRPVKVRRLGVFAGVKHRLAPLSDFSKRRLQIDFLERSGT